MDRGARSAGTIRRQHRRRPRRLTGTPSSCWPEQRELCLPGPCGCCDGSAEFRAKPRLLCSNEDRQGQWQRRRCCRFGGKAVSLALDTPAANFRLRRLVAFLYGGFKRLLRWFGGRLRLDRGLLRSSLLDRVLWCGLLRRRLYGRMTVCVHGLLYWNLGG